MMPWMSSFMSSSLPAVLPLVSRNSVTSTGTDSIDTASIVCSTPLSVSRKSLAVRFATTLLPFFTEALTATETAAARKTACCCRDCAGPGSARRSPRRGEQQRRRRIMAAPRRSSRSGGQIAEVAVEQQPPRVVVVVGDSVRDAFDRGRRPRGVAAHRIAAPRARSSPTASRAGRQRLRKARRPVKLARAPAPPGRNHARDVLQVRICRGLARRAPQRSPGRIRPAASAGSQAASAPRRRPTDRHERRHTVWGTRSARTAPAARKPPRPSRDDHERRGQGSTGPVRSPPGARPFRP